MRRVNLPEDLEGPNDLFFTRQLVDLVVNQAGTKSVTPWSCFPKTPQGQYESIYTKLREMTNILLAKGAKGYFWIIVPPEINELIESHADKKYVTVPMEQLPLGYNCVMFMGVYEKRWRVYTDPLLTDTIVMGATFSKKNPSYYATLKLQGYGQPEGPDPKEFAKSLMEGLFPPSQVHPQN